MEWLNRFKLVLQTCPNLSDDDLFSIFPELKNSPERLNAALLFPYNNVVAEEFKPIPPDPPKKKKWLNWIR